MTAGIQSFFVGTLGLLVALVISIAFAYSRKKTAQLQFDTLKPLLATAVCFHLLHLTEETLYDFHLLFPALLGIAPWPISVFLGFNGAWVLVWVAGIFMIPPNRLTITTFWFLAIASAINGVAHPVLSLVVGGYFPGLVTSPVVGLIGVLLIRKLSAATRNSGPLQTIG